MKTKQTILTALASVALAMGAFASADAQTNLGASCGCPAVNTRPNQNISEYAPFIYQTVPGAYGGELTAANTALILTCDKNWILDKKIYIPSGKALTIQPGTVIKGALAPDAANATALIIERGGKIIAPGTESCPIVFTAAADPMDGTYGVSNIGKWGGVILLGRATNNLTLAANGPFVPGGAGKLAVANGLGTVEGFASTLPQDQYGVALSLPTNVTQTAVASPASATYNFGLNLNADQTGGTVGSTIGLSGQKKFTVSSSSLAAYVFVGMGVSGTGVPAGATVTSVSSATITITANLTANAAGTYVFTGTYPSAPGTVQNYYTVSSAPSFVSPATNGYGPFDVLGGLTNFAAPFAGATAGTFDDDDNSGIMKYVSIRHSGAILSVGAEINGLTLASVGRGTTIDHIEIVSCADDNIEIFGGTVNLKYVTMMFGGDDMFDYDLGWTGKAQFVFGMKNTTSYSTDADNGVEADADDNKSNLLPRSHPVIYNMTLLGNTKTALTSDNSALAAINAKELTEGEIYNSVFGGWERGLNLIISSGSGVASTSARNYVTGGDSWHNWTNIAGPASATAGNGSQSLKVKCNTFVGVTSPLTIANANQASGTGYTQFTTTDLNTVAATVPGFTYAFDMTSTASSNAVVAKNDVTPNPALGITGCPTPPVDGFFEPANYRGAFSSVNGENWLSNWTYSQVLNATTGVRACATDLNLDGTTDVNDFLIFAPAFGTSCN